MACAVRCRFRYRNRPALQLVSRYVTARMRAEAVWRRVPPGRDNVDEDRPNSDNFVNGEPTADDPAPAMSVMIERLAVEFGRTHGDVLTGCDGFGLVRLAGDLLESLGLVVTEDPLPDESAHGTVRLPSGRALQRRLAKASTWLVRPDPR